MPLTTLEQQMGLDLPVGRPPVEKWNPELSGDIDIVIRKDGSWWHEGEQIKREKLVRLFASILRKDGDEYFLLTPVEKWRIQVEDRPLLVNLIDHKGDNIQLLTNGGDSLVIGPEHPLKVSELDGVNIPEVLVRHDLWARFSRNAFYQLSDMAQVDKAGRVMVCSGGETFELK